MRFVKEKTVETKKAIEEQDFHLKRLGDQLSRVQASRESIISQE